MSTDPITASWETNAAAWTTAVRDGLIPSRRAGTDAAIVEICLRLAPRRMLDVGCGEGWLARAIGEQGVQVTGVDASAPLIYAARETGGATFEVASYDTLISDAAVVPGPWDLVVCNFALLGHPVAPLLSALRDRLSTGGHLLIQTVHPWVAAGEGAYASEWRTETFAAFPVAFPAHMPWYFRTLADWIHQTRLAGLMIEEVVEPLHPETRRPLSMILSLVRQ